MHLTPRPGILEITPYIGGEAKLPGANRVIRLASNENPLGTGPRAVAAYAAEQDELHRYPDGGARALREAIGEAHGVEPDRVVCGSGIDELIGLLVRAYAGPGDEVLYSAHGFLMYAIAAKGAGAAPVTAPERDLTADVDALLEAVTPRTRLLFLANPNNPTGSYLPADEVRRLREGLPDGVLLVLDAAYAEYVRRDDYEAGADLVRAFDNVVMTRTFSKIHGLAALRLGWAYCSAEVADVLNRLRGPFNVSSAAQAAGVAALSDREHVARSQDNNARWLEWFSQEARRLGLTVPPSVGNFVLVRFPDRPGRDAAAAAEHLKGQGILVRGMGAYDLGDSLRVTIGTEQDMRAVAEALAGFVA
ncbi:MAG: histidinol-phosphate transaminase [Rhodospirillales bacterium]|nr:histidinol-phosphate transaminase [Rhodospirillales bacterium]MDH3910056.1 histidinol-phosphate transaminase [Rhodospirillales bacterium]MDH3967537.1 histidinol-phosphate transaminase [Rhodospirillales bacterium]